MAFAYWMVLVAAVLPYLAFGLAQRGNKALYDPHQPRDATPKLAGMSKRAHAAHMNSFETFAPFVAGVLIAGQAGVAHNLVNELAGAFVVLRIVYIAAYVGDKPPLRSACWGLSSLCSFALIALAALK